MDVPPASSLAVAVYGRYVAPAMKGYTTTAGRGRTSFPSTRWPLILQAQGRTKGSPDMVVSESRREAFETLISDYWRPLYYFVRRRTNNVEDAKDLTQSFFTTLLDKDYLKDVRRERGRFRTFLLVALDHFLANEWDKRRALKRGGGRQMLSLDFEDAERHFARDFHERETPEKLYVRKWAQTLVAQVLDALEEEYHAKGKADLFAEIKPHLQGGKDYVEVAARLRLSVANVKVLVHRARRRFGDLLRKRVRDTVRSEDEVEQELQELLSEL